MGFSRYSKRVVSSQCTPLLTFAAVYEKPSTCPLWRPNKLEKENENDVMFITKAHTHADLLRSWAANRQDR